MTRMLLILALAGLASAEFVKIGFRDCKSAFKVTEVMATDCVVKDLEGGKKVCEFKEGTTPVIRIKFIADADVSALTTSVKAKVGESMIDFPMTDSDSCKFGISCPLKKGTEYTYEQGIQIINNYPKNERVQVNWVLDREGTEGKDICIIFNAKIVN